MIEARDKYAEGPDAIGLLKTTESVLLMDVEDAKVQESRRLEPVREAQKRFKPYIAECRLLLDELRGIEREYRPTLDKLEKIRWQEVNRRRDVAVQRAAYYAQNALRDALSTLNHGPRNIQSILDACANLKPDDFKGRDPIMYLIEDVTIARRVPGGIRRSLIFLHENLVKLDRALAQNVQAQKDRETFSIPMDRGPQFELPKEPPKKYDEQQTHAKMD